MEKRHVGMLKTGFSTAKVYYPSFTSSPYSLRKSLLDELMCHWRLQSIPALLMQKHPCDITREVILAFVEPNIYSLLAGVAPHPFNEAVRPDAVDSLAAGTAQQSVFTSVGNLLIDLNRGGLRQSSFKALLLWNGSTLLRIVVRGAGDSAWAG